MPLVFTLCAVLVCSCSDPQQPSGNEAIAPRPKPILVSEAIKGALNEDFETRTLPLVFHVRGTDLVLVNPTQFNLIGVELQVFPLGINTDMYTTPAFGVARRGQVVIPLRALHKIGSTDQPIGVNAKRAWFRVYCKLQNGNQAIWMGPAE